jgi:hypothetical protein
MLATIERSFKIQPLTKRDRAAMDLSRLASLAAPRDVRDIFGELSRNDFFDSV